MASPLSDGEGIPLIEPLSDDSRPSSPSKKRKRSAAKDDETKRAEKRAKRKAKKPKDIDDTSLDADLGVNLAIAGMDPRLMADHLAQRTRRFQPELSLVEAEELFLSASAITDTTAFAETRTTAKLTDFMEQFASINRKKRKAGLAGAGSSPGRLHTLVVAGAGLRAADLTRALRKFQTKESMVAKLFAKHIKLNEAVELVKKTRMGIGVGTPQRIADLLEDGALQLDELERVVVDASHIDQKKRGILDMKELLVPLVKLLTRDGLKERFGTGGEKQIDLLFY